MPVNHLWVEVVPTAQEEYLKMTQWTSGKTTTTLSMTALAQRVAA